MAPALHHPAGLTGHLLPSLFLLAKVAAPSAFPRVCWPASEEQRADDITLSGVANEFSGVDHRHLSCYHDAERERVAAGRRTPALLRAPLVRTKFSLRVKR